MKEETIMCRRCEVKEGTVPIYKGDEALCENCANFLESRAELQADMYEYE